MPNKKHLIPTLFACLAFATAYGQQLSIKGNAPAFKKGALYLYTIADFINGNEVLLDSSIVSSTGDFAFKPTVKQTLYTYIKTGGLQYDLFVEPGKPLELIIPDTAGFAKDSVLKPITITNQPGGLNEWLTRFDGEYNDFLIANYKLFLRKTGQKAATAFITAMQPKYAAYNHPYFTTYVLYRTGSLELLAGVKSTNGIIENYFNNKPVLYNNIAYMDLVNEVFEKSLKAAMLKKDGLAIKSAINVNINYEGTLDLLKRDTVLTNDTLRELALIKGLGEVFYTPGMVQYSILEMLTYATTHALTPTNRLVAQNLAQKLEKLRPGTDAPAFKLHNIVTGADVSLADFKGKPVYLSFWNEDNTRSVEEIDLIKELEKKYGKKITFISICNAPNETKTLAFINRNKYKWVFLNSKGSKKLIDDYEVFSYPSFYLIDANGKIIKCPADRPSGNIDRTLNDLYNKK